MIQFISDRFKVLLRLYNLGKNRLTNKQRTKIKPFHKLSDSEKEHLRRSGRYIPLVKLTFWQQLRANTANSIKNAISFKTLGQAVNASVLIGAITFIAGEQQRRASQVYQAWQVITVANGQSGSGGRIQALEFLNSEPRRIPWFWLHWEQESLSGLEAPKAYLVPSRKDTNKRGIQLQYARLDNANLQGALLSLANLQGAILSSTNFQGARLGAANLQNAILFDANLQKARLDSANLQGATLIGANLQGARLDNANLQGARLDNANLQGAILDSTNLLEVRLDNVNLQGAKYTDKNTSQKTCQEIVYNDFPCPTVFPPNFDPKTKGMILLK